MDKIEIQRAFDKRVEESKVSFVKEITPESILNGTFVRTTVLPCEDCFVFVSYLPKDKKDEAEIVLSIPIDGISPISLEATSNTHQFSTTFGRYPLTAENFDALATETLRSIRVGQNV